MVMSYEPNPCPLSTGSEKTKSRITTSKYRIDSWRRDIVSVKRTQETKSSDEKNSSWRTRCLKLWNSENFELRKHGNAYNLRMPAFNDLGLANWKEIDLNMDSLWVINERAKGGKRSNFYHGNFIPQIPNHFIQRYTKKWGWVFDPFLGSATTAVECEELGRNIIGIDIQESLIERAKTLVPSDKIHTHFWVGDSSSSETLSNIQKILSHRKIEGVDLAILHPPYFDIIQFSDQKWDLSNTKNVDDFLGLFGKILSNTYQVLKKWWYMVVVIGDAYKNSEWIPLWFMCMSEAQKSWFKLKSIIVKNMEGNRAKLGTGGIWQYRALSSDYYIFKHEYILVFKK